MPFKEVKDILKPYGHTDVLFYYSAISKHLKNFLKGKEIAAKIWLPSGNIHFFLRRGSSMQPLYIEDFDAVDENFLKIRAETELEKARGKISKQQEKIWGYFVPRKLIDFFYATNGEHPGHPINRIFIDLDRGAGVSEEEARVVASELVKIIRLDKELRKLVKFRIFIMWTGSSFHIYLLFDKKFPNSFYERYFKYSKEAPEASFIGKWARQLKALRIKVSGGHEKTPGTVTLDPSQTPSGKLARSPFSLHMGSAKEINGIALPLNEKQLSDRSIIKKLKAYTLEKVLKEISQFAKNLP
jgi:DNA primase